MDVIRIALLGFTGVLLGLIVRECRPEFSFYISLACGICIFLLASVRVQYLIESIQSVRNRLPVDASYLNVLLKMIGISVWSFQKNERSSKYHYASNLSKASFKS